MATKIQWTFYLKGASRILNDNGEGEVPFIEVVAPTYDKAVKKCLKMQIPNVASEEDLAFFSAQESEEDLKDDSVPAN